MLGVGYPGCRKRNGRVDIVVDAWNVETRIGSLHAFMAGMGRAAPDSRGVPGMMQSRGRIVNGPQCEYDPYQLAS